MANTITKRQKLSDIHPIGQLLDDWTDWVINEEESSISIKYDEDDDSFLVSRDGRKAVLYTSDIDENFYGERKAIFVESEVGVPPQNLDWSQTLKFSGNELVLSRISLSERGDNTVLIVEAAVPIEKLDFSIFDLMVKEVATIAKDLRNHLSEVLDMPAPAGDDEDELEKAEEHAEEEG